MEEDKEILELKKWLQVGLLIGMFWLGYYCGYKAGQPQRIFANPNFCATETDATTEENVDEEPTIPPTVSEHIKEYKIKGMYAKNHSYYVKEPVKIEPKKTIGKVTSPLVEVQSQTAVAGFVGTYQLTAYTHTGNPMANGQMPYVGAVACNSLPLGTVIYIEGYGNFVVCDRGGMGGGVIDIFMNTYDECIQFGRRSANVYIVQ